MAQSTPLPAGTTEATSTDITVAVGSTAKVGLFVSTGATWDGISPKAALYITEDTPGADQNVVVGGVEAVLNVNNRSVLLGPGVYNVYRPSIAGLVPTGHVGIGVFAES